MQAGTQKLQADEEYATNSPRELNPSLRRSIRSIQTQENQLPEGCEENGTGAAATPSDDGRTEGGEGVDSEAQWPDNEACLPRHLVSSPIRVYQCLRRPEYVAHEICIWEKEKQIDQLIDVHKDAPIGQNIFIPNEAAFVIVGDTIISEPFGSVLLFSRVVDLYTPQERYQPVIGFYYNHSKQTSSIVWSITEKFEAMISLGIVSLYERVRPEDTARFIKIYALMTEAVNAEMGEIAKGRRELRNNAGCNRAATTRWRSRMVWDKERTARGY